MALGRVDRIALVVSDVDAAAAELKQLFDIDMHIHDVSSMRSRVGLCDEGFELIEPHARPAGGGTGMLAAIGIRVDDLEQARVRMAAHGYELTSEIESPGGIRELFYTKGVAGFPVVLAEYAEGRFATEAGATKAGPFTPRWISGGTGET
jgi:hypothetical protein